MGKPCISNVSRPRATWGAWPCAHKRDDHYPINSKLHYVSASIVWSYYACCGHIPGPIHSYAVLYTEKLAFQCITLQSYSWEYTEYKRCTSVATVVILPVYTLGLQLFAGTTFSEFHNSLIWRVLISADCSLKFWHLPGFLNFPVIKSSGTVAISEGRFLTVVLVAR